MKKATLTQLELVQPAVCQQLLSNPKKIEIKLEYQEGQIKALPAQQPWY